VKTVLAQARLILRNDLRLLWRDLLGGRMKLFGSALVIVLVLLVLHALSILFFLGFRSPPALGAEAGVWAFFGFLMLGAAMTQAIGLFFERADFDLLLASPVSPRAVLLARLAAMITSALLGAGLLLWPLLNGIIIGFSVRYVSGYLAWFFLATGVASVGVWLTLALVRLLGTRRARIWVQIVAGLLGASVYLSFQLQRFISPGLRDTFVRFLGNAIEYAGFEQIALAARGGIQSLLLVAAVAALLAALTTRLLARTFLTGLQESALRPARRPRRNKRVYRFTGDTARATFRKDLRLIARDPLLISQLLPSTMYIIPAFLGFGHFGKFTVLAPIAVVVAAQFSMLLADVAVAGEECLDLIRASPSPEVRLRRAKMAAGMAMPLAASFLVCVAIALLGRPGLGLLTFFTGAGTAAAGAWLSVTQTTPVTRNDILSRRGVRRRASPLRVIASSALIVSACTGITMVAHGSLWLIGVVLLGATAIGVIACFTLVSAWEIATDESSSAWKPRPATTS
jgi:ABC-2 type transport system permease protein